MAGMTAFLLSVSISVHVRTPHKKSYAKQIRTNKINRVKCTSEHRAKKQVYVYSNCSVFITQSVI